MGVGSIFSGSLIDALGRKPGHLILAFSFIVSWVVQAFAVNNPLMLLGRCLTGLCSGAIRPIALVYLGEIADPRVRGLMLFTPSQLLISGVILNHALGGYVHWSTNSLICITPCVAAFLLSLGLIKESPLWLISKGKIEEGVQVFKWFRGESDAAEKELKTILERQNEKNTVLTIKDYFKKEFLKPFILSLFLSIGTHFSGANVLTFYAQDILGLLIPNDFTPYALMVTTDCVRLVAATVIFFIVNRFPRKLSLIFCSFSASILLYCLIGFLYWNPPNMKWLTIILLIAYVTMASAIVTYAWSFVAELFPSQFRGIGSGVSSSTSYFALFIIVKITPGVISAYGVNMLYFGFATITAVNAAILYYWLPETNGKSLQDIEDEFNKKDKTIVSKL